MTNHPKPTRNMKREIPVFQYDDEYAVLSGRLDTLRLISLPCIRMVSSLSLS